MFLKYFILQINDKKNVTCFLEQKVIGNISVHISIRRTAKPTAEMETRVPIQYFITSYFAASKCALNEWIS